MVFLTLAMTPFPLQGGRKRNVLTYLNVQLTHSTTQQSTVHTFMTLIAS